MNKLIKYIIIFILFSLFGWTYENILLNKKSQDTTLTEIIGINAPFLLIYGVGGILIFYTYSNFPHMKLLSKIIIASILINSVECISGKLSYYIRGYHTWNYNKCFYPLCDGYISLFTIILWTLMITMILLIFSYLDKKNK
uniref:ABC-transporter type IV n=1 Tax=viral metagenome TaxID=1070528 RepID=A0A6C0LSB1_9ZZZZ